MASDLEKLDSEKVENRPGLGVGRRERGGSYTSSVTRVRSNNGHGCADLEESDDIDDVDDEFAPEVPRAEKDPFEVAWDGDDDPLCPRSMSLIRKWMVVITVGLGSLCV